VNVDNGEFWEGTGKKISVVKKEKRVMIRYGMSYWEQNSLFLEMSGAKKLDQPKMSDLCFHLKDM
jgi:hypothetical protein